MQPLRFIQQAIPRIRGPKQHTSTAGPPIRVSQNFANQGNQESRLRITREDHYTPEKFRMECVGKTCCAVTYRILLPAGIPLPEIVSGLSHTGAGEGI
jgi:hypothetical protein